MSFEYAPVSKGLMMSLGLSSVLVGVFDVKHYTHLQLVPHLSRHHQYWRLLAHHLVFENSSDLFLAEILLFNMGIQVERRFGSAKFASFVVVTTLLVTIAEFAALLLFNKTGLNYIPAGPTGPILSIVYQYSRLIPGAYMFRIFGAPLSNKSFQYLVALQLALTHMPGSLVTAAIGLIASQLYHTDMLNLQSYRLPTSVIWLSSKYILPILGSLRAPRRSNRAFPDEPRTSTATETQPAQNDEVITTARQPANVESGGHTNQVPSSTSVVREWVNELTGRTEGAPTVRTPSEAEIAQVVGMFPDLRREVVIGALQRSLNIEAAVETLLSSQN